jgi:hypothetical protein
VIDATVQDDATARLASMGGAVRDSLRAATESLAAQLADAAMALLPAGPLADSLEATVDDDGTAPRATLGSALPYARVIDQGFAGTEDVRESLRLQSVAFGRPMTPRQVLVRAHARQVDIPGRAYLTGALDTMADTITETYRMAVDEALRS